MALETPIVYGVFTRLSVYEGGRTTQKRKYGRKEGTIDARYFPHPPPFSDLEDSGQQRPRDQQTTDPMNTNLNPLLGRPTLGTYLGLLLHPIRPKR